jgi:hypothetical protein
MTTKLGQVWRMKSRKDKSGKKIPGYAFSIEKLNDDVVLERKWLEGPKKDAVFLSSVRHEAFKGSAYTFLGNKDTWNAEVLQDTIGTLNLHQDTQKVLEDMIKNGFITSKGACTLFEELGGDTQGFRAKVMLLAFHCLHPTLASCLVQSSAGSAIRNIYGYEREILFDIPRNVLTRLRISGLLRTEDLVMNPVPEGASDAEVMERTFDEEFDDTPVLTTIDNSLYLYIMSAHRTDLV